MVAQATALPRLCCQLRLAKRLRELVLDLDGGAAYALPAELTLQLFYRASPRQGFVAAQDTAEVDAAPARIDAALTWLQHCHRFDLDEPVQLEVRLACN